MSEAPQVLVAPLFVETAEFRSAVTMVNELSFDVTAQVVVFDRNGAQIASSALDGVIRQIRESHADMLFVGMPSPFKEVWSFQNLGALGVPVVLPVGGAFDIFSGELRRAPLWLQRVGLEWSWRLMMEPRQKWRRYLYSNSVFVWLCLRSLVGQPQ